MVADGECCAEAEEVIPMAVEGGVSLRVFFGHHVAVCPRPLTLLATEMVSLHGGGPFHVARDLAQHLKLSSSVCDLPRRWHHDMAEAHCMS